MREIMDNKKLMIQLSSGQGPAECELAVGMLYETLKKEFPDIELISGHPGKEQNCYTSMIFSTEQNLSCLEGSVQWICRSPFRPNHKRKNWFVDVSVIPEARVICKEQDIRFERFHSSGKGGQNVNKVETGVRMIHIPTGITVTSTAERSQHANRKNALVKLNAILNEMEQTEQKKMVKSAWSEHTRIVRGNPVRVYEGMEFRMRNDRKGKD